MKRPSEMLSNFASAAWLACTLVFAVGAPSAQASTFYQISSITSNTSNDYFPVSNLIEGAGVGFDANAPHDQTGLLWATDRVGYPTDYFNFFANPVLVLDLGQNVLLSEISVWGYTLGNTNGVSQFALRFATAADGTGGFGTSVAFNPGYALQQQATTMQEFMFGQDVTARYVEFTVLDNYYNPNDPFRGGDRVGLGEIAFAHNVPEPATLALVALGFVAVASRRQRKQAS